MSTEEQDAVLGRLTRDRTDKRRHLAAIDAEIDTYKSKLRKLQNSIEAMLRQKESSSDHPDALNAVLDIDIEKLRNLVNQRGEVIRDLQDVNTRLADAGIP